MIYSPIMKSSKLRRVGLVGSIVLCIGILLQVLYDPISSVRHSLKVASVRAELPQAREKWNSLHITDYKFQIQGDGRSICMPYANIEVHGDKVVKVETINPIGILSPDYWADPAWGDEVFLCSYLHYTMPQIFDLVAITLRNFPSSITQAEFDLQYGFVSRFRFGIYVGDGLLRPRIDNCCNEFKITEFHPLPPQ